MSEYNRRHTKRVTSNTQGESLTKQSDRHEADINTIMKRYRQTGDASVFMQRTGGYYADVSSVGDYHAAVEMVREADQAFSALDAEIRDKFANDPANLIAALADPEAKKMLEEIGILDKPADTAEDTAKKTADTIENIKKAFAPAKTKEETPNENN